MYDWNTDWNNHQQQASNTTISTDTTNTATSKNTATSPLLSGNEQYDYYSSYPTPPTPAGSTVSGNSDCVYLNLTRHCPLCEYIICVQTQTTT